MHCLKGGIVRWVLRSARDPGERVAGDSTKGRTAKNFVAGYGAVLEAGGERQNKGSILRGGGGYRVGNGYRPRCTG